MAKSKTNISITVVLLLGLVLFLFMVYLAPWKSEKVPIAPVQVPSEIQVVVAQDYTDTLKNVYAPPVRYREIEYRQLGYLTCGLTWTNVSRMDWWMRFGPIRFYRLVIEFVTK